MKVLNLFLTAAIVAFNLCASATIINVNNSTPSPGEYDNITDAVTAAQAGDTIYLAATSLNYGDVTLDKQLHIIGPGFTINEGILGTYAEIGEIEYIDATACSGSSVESIRIYRYYVNDPATAVNFSNMTIKRCYFNDYIYTWNDVLANSVIEGNVFPSASFNLYPSNYSNCAIRNNFFRGSISGIATSIVEHNIFVGGGADVWFGGSTNTNYVNNIIIGRNVGVTIGSNTINGNCSFGGSNNIFQGAGTNFENVDPEFVNYIGAAFSFAADYNLSNSSPLIGAGAGGEDIGIYGGSGVYRQDGEPTIPIIRSLNVPGGTTVPANSTFNINIISEAHE